MSSSSGSLTRDDKPLEYAEQLDAFLEDLHDLDLSSDIFDETPYLSAHGGYCDIFTAKSRKNCNMIVAVKRLRMHILHNKDASKIILRELRIWSSLKHPNILPLLGFVMHGNYPAFVSLWMVNGSLRTYMQNKPKFSLSYMAREIARGLHYLHDHGIVHSDLKGDNILISILGKPLLADFGISHIITTSAASTTTGVGGSVRRMAVELLAMEAGKHTKQTDVWAYGMVIYYFRSS